MTGRPRFSAPKFATEESFLDLMNRKFHVLYPSAYSAATWLDQNGYWKSFTITTTTTLTIITTTTTTKYDYGGGV